MENIKELAIEFTTIIGAFSIITGWLQKWLKRELSDMKHNIKQMDMSQCRTYLVEFLSDVENGIKKDQAQMLRACEVYDHYRKDLQGNSYIQDKWEKLIK